MKSGTCQECGRVHKVVGGKLIQHNVGSAALLRERGARPVRRNQGIKIRCPGSEGTPKETLQRNRERARKKSIDARRALLDSWNGNAAVLLDALLNNRSDLNAEFDRSEALRIALKGYHLEYPKEHNFGHGLLWVNGRKEHKLYCRFCGELVATMPLGLWSKSSSEQKFEMVGRRVLICALQYLAGLRQIVLPGTMIEADEADQADQLASSQQEMTICHPIGAL